jgi:hypothetical protein
MIVTAMDWMDTFRSHSGHSDLMGKELHVRLFLQFDISVERSTPPFKVIEGPIHIKAGKGCNVSTHLGG